MKAGSHTEEAPSSPSTPADRLVERLAERLGSTARATAVFGEPVECDGVTVIPVAKARWGFGGGDGQPGSGRWAGRTGRARAGHAAEDSATDEGATGGSAEGREAPGSGGGGGGGVAVVPVGFIEVSQGGARFRRIVDQGTIVALGAMALLAAGMVWRVAVRLER